MDKFVISNKQNITQNLDENITNEQEIHQKELEDNEMIQLQDNNDVQFYNTTNLDNELQNNLEENENNDENVTNEQVHHTNVQLEENENNDDMLLYSFNMSLFLIKILEHFTHHVVVIVLTLYYAIWPILVQKLYHLLELYNAYIHCFLLLQKDENFYKIMCQV